MKRVWLASAVIVCLSSAAFAQDNPISASTKATYEIVKGYITKAADKVPDDQYAFKPTPDVRSFGQLIGHVADSNYQICGGATGEKGPAGSIEKTQTSKAELVKALAASFAFCDKAYASMTDAKGAELVPFFGSQKMARVSVLAFNNSHDFEHYGNMVTYMRLKGIVPPSSQPTGN
ncbi:MAG: DinB family protein [Vicinamibacterales bacterium]